MTLFDVLFALLGMIVATLFCRLIPLFLPERWLNRSWLVAINRSLPLAIMVILLLASLKIEEGDKESLLHVFYQILSLLIVLWVYHKSRNTLLSIIVGVGALNLLFWI